jgi:tRNA(fMet)-specific endonuclease VapC
MTYLLDTNAFSNLMREDPKLERRLAGLTESDRVVICTIVRGEIQYGIERLASGRKQRQLREKADRLFGVLPCEPIHEAAGDHYANVKRERERQGLPLDENDLWIAATALALAAVLVTHDAGFHRIPGLHVEDWTA